MRIKLLHPWKGWPAGHVFTEMTRGAARVLESRGYAVILDRPAIVDVPVKRGPGRPRKRVISDGTTAGH